MFSYIAKDSIEVTQELMTEVTKEHYFISKLIKLVNTEACISDCRVSVCYKTRPEKRPCLIPAPCRRLFIMSNFSVCGLYSQKEGWPFITPQVCLLATDMSDGLLTVSPPIIIG